MEYLVYCRDKDDTQALRKQWVEAHWTFMDEFAPRMVARGPTVQEDGVTQTGSLHIVDLEDDAAARHFAYDEPYARAGVFREILVRRWRNSMGRTMWDFEGRQGQQRFLILGFGKAGGDAQRDSLLEAHRAYLADPVRSGCFVFRGPLLAEDGKTWVGSAMAVEMPDRAAVDAMLAAEPFTRAGLFERTEVHRWRFGGRR